MKKLMKKKVSLMGKEFSVLAFVAVMMVGFASAALVTYLSNEVSADVKVESPIEMFIRTETSDPWACTANLADMYGGQEKVFYTRIVNRINEPILNKPFTVTITNVAGDATCADFTMMSIGAVSGVPVLNSNCFEATAGVVTIPGVQSLAALETDDDTIGFEFALNVKPDTYTFTTQIMNA